MDFSLAKCVDEPGVLNPSNVVITDNDSGYISQHVESNSSLDMNISKQVIISSSPQFFVSEDALLENPLSEKKEKLNNVLGCNLSDSIIQSSVSSYNDSFNLNVSDSGGSDTSATIPIVNPIVIAYDKINDSYSDKEDGTVEKEDMDLNSSERSSQTSENNKSLNSTFNDEIRSSVQTRMMNANNDNLSTFESFYSYLCELYTKQVEELPINPIVVNSVSTTSSANNSYIELETINSKTKPAIDPNDFLNIDNDSVLGKSNGNAVDKETEIATNNSKSTPRKKNTSPELQKKAVINVSAEKVEVATSQNHQPTTAELSPELFSDEDMIAVPTKRVLQGPKEVQDKYVTTIDKKLYKHAQENLSGVPPPPSVTILQITIDDMLKKIESNKHLFITASDLKSISETSSNSSVDETNSGQGTRRKSMVVDCNRQDFIAEDWPDILNYRYHGLHFNRSKISEDFENLCTKYAERCVGAETQSTCTVFGFSSLQSPSRHKCRFKRTLKSPGKRLSHLARRRITFSKDSLNSSMGSASCSFIGARTRQIMVDVRKCQLLAKRKSPRKKTPRKTPSKSPRKTPSKNGKRKVATPSSSTKKRYSMRLKIYNADDSMDSNASTSNSRASITKRALFQSPPGRESMSISKDSSNDSSNHSARRRTPRRALFPSPIKSSPSKMTISSLYPAKRKLTPKRALFTSPEKSAIDKKRKRTDSECEPPNRLSRSSSNLNQSIEISLQNAVRARSSSSTSTSQSSQDVADIRKKKLMWSVAEALRNQNVETKHPQFKIYASVLARVIRSFLPTLFTNGPRHEGSTTESMLRIGRKYAFAVTRGKTVDEIIYEARAEKAKNKKSESLSSNPSEPSHTRNWDSVLQDRVNIIGSSRSGIENKSGRRENVERIRKVINFGDDDINSHNAR